MNRDLTRRRLLSNALLAASGAAAGSMTSSRVFSATENYQGPLLVTLQMSGGADVTSWCDPKVNIPGEPKINYWADEAGPLKANGISYAPFAQNELLFKKYAKDMLVINGIDAQTNAHSTGIVFNWSGRNSNGAPSLTALHAAKNAPRLPLTYTSMGGFSFTSSLTRFTRIGDIDSIRTLLNPFIDPYSNTPMRPESESALVADFMEKSIADLESASLSRRQLATLKAYKESREVRGGLARLVDILPPQGELQEPEYLATPSGGMQSLLKQRIQGALLIFKSGLGSAVDLELTGFDSHDQNDRWQGPLLSHVSEAVDYFWSYAQELGIANRITLVIGSDFGRTNYYNISDGKDHWNIGSTIIMKKDAPWGGRVVGVTDERHFGIPINPTTLKRAPSTGITMTPAHVHLALRKQLGLRQFADNAGFALDVESVDMFNPAKRTVA